MPYLPIKIYRRKIICTVTRYCKLLFAFDAFVFNIIEMP
jgi:hypothetical protein